MIELKIIQPPKGALEKQLWEAIRRQLAERIHDLECPVHHEHPRVVVSGSIQKPEFKVEGCCQSLIDKVNQALK